LLEKAAECRKKATRSKAPALTETRRPGEPPFGGQPARHGVVGPTRGRPRRTPVRLPSRNPSPDVMRRLVTGYADPTAPSHRAEGAPQREREFIGAAGSEGDFEARLETTIARGMAFFVDVATRVVSWGRLKGERGRRGGDCFGGEGCLMVLSSTSLRGDDDGPGKRGLRGGGP
jgi:hypothetical protein